MAQPDLIITPFADSAVPGTIDPIPESQDPALPQRASWLLGFPGVTMTPLAAGGIPPRGQDFNGVLNALSQHIVWIGRGGQYVWDAGIAAAGGYPLGALLQKSGIDGFWLNTAEGNTTNPDAGGAGWVDANSATLPYANDTGAANAYVATYTPAISSLSTGQVVRFKASNANTGASTFNPNGLGAKPIVTLSGSPLSAGAISANGHAWLQYDAAIGGGSWVLLIGGVSTPSNILTSGIAGAFSNLRSSATGLSASVSVTADALCLKNSSNEQIVINSVSVTPSLATSGSNGLDTGTSATNTWYSVWVIWNGTTTAGLLSLSSTSPTMPSGYTHKARIGWVRTDSSANRFPLSFIQSGKVVQYVPASGSNLLAMPAMAIGVSGTSGPITGNISYSTVSTANFIPPTAQRISVELSAYVASGSQLASFSTSSALNNNIGVAPPAAYPMLSIHTASNGAGGAISGTFNLSSANVFYASSFSNSQLSCTGWEDNL